MPIVLLLNDLGKRAQATSLPFVLQKGECLEQRLQEARVGLRILDSVAFVKVTVALIVTPGRGRSPPLRLGWLHRHRRRRGGRGCRHDVSGSNHEIPRRAQLEQRPV